MSEFMIRSEGADAAALKGRNQVFMQLAQDLDTLPFYMTPVAADAPSLDKAHAILEIVKGKNPGVIVHEYQKDGAAYTSVGVVIPDGTFDENGRFSGELLTTIYDGSNTFVSSERPVVVEGRHLRERITPHADAQAQELLDINLYLINPPDTPASPVHGVYSRDGELHTLRHVAQSDSGSTQVEMHVLPEPQTVLHRSDRTQAALSVGSVEPYTAQDESETIRLLMANVGTSDIIVVFEVAAQPGEDPNRTIITAMRQHAPEILPKTTPDETRTFLKDNLTEVLLLLRMQQAGIHYTASRLQERTEGQKL